MRRTSVPPSAKTRAIPAPIVPAPITATSRRSRIAATVPLRFFLSSRHVYRKVVQQDLVDLDARPVPSALTRRHLAQRRIGPAHPPGSRRVIPSAVPVPGRRAGARASPSPCVRTDSGAPAGPRRGPPSSIWRFISATSSSTRVASSPSNRAMRAYMPNSFLGLPRPRGTRGRGGRPSRPRSPPRASSARGSAAPAHSGGQVRDHRERRDFEAGPAGEDHLRTVDMPTAVPPRILAARISAGVSNCGPENHT